MRRLVAIAAGILFLAGVSGAAFAQSKCDSKITKGAGKKCSCKAGVHAKAQAKGLAPDPAKLAKCEEKFNKACSKGQAAGDCVVQLGACASIEADVDACVATLISSASPSGAFLE
jgi:hypothetical protein